MKAAIVGLALLVGGSGLALADQPGPDWMSPQQAMSRLQSLGYSSISKIKADDGQWEGKGTKNGQVYEFHLDPHTGALTKEEPDEDRNKQAMAEVPPGADWMSIGAAKARLQAQGYSNITKIEADDGHYEGKATKNGQVHEFHLDPHTGMVTKDEVDED